MSSQPPLALYRSILRAHRRLPKEMRQLGDVYVRSEFKQHKGVSQPAQLDRFFTEWHKYLDSISMTVRARDSLNVGSLDNNNNNNDAEKNNGSGSNDLFAYGADIDPSMLTKEQQEQLEKLREETTKR